VIKGYIRTIVLDFSYLVTRRPFSGGLCPFHEIIVSFFLLIRCREVHTEVQREGEGCRCEKCDDVQRTRANMVNHSAIITAVILRIIIITLFK